MGVGGEIIVVNNHDAPGVGVGAELQGRLADMRVCMQDRYTIDIRYKYNIEYIDIQDRYTIDK